MSASCVLLKKPNSPDHIVRKSGKLRSTHFLNPLHHFKRTFLVNCLRKKIQRERRWLDSEKSGDMTAANTILIGLRDTPGHSSSTLSFWGELFCCGGWTAKSSRPSALLLENPRFSTLTPLCFVRYSPPRGTPVPRPPPVRVQPSAQQQKQKCPTRGIFDFGCCGGWTRTSDLQVMSLTSYHCSTPR